MALTCAACKLKNAEDRILRASTTAMTALVEVLSRQENTGASQSLCAITVATSLEVKDCSTAPCAVQA